MPGPLKLDRQGHLADYYSLPPPTLPLPYGERDGVRGGHPPHWAPAGILAVSRSDQLPPPPPNLHLMPI